ncbi:MAG: DNA-processing protein DprA [Bacteroidota bacterium]|nr:DNA-processing protein DprA [Bacteroidota bacterium]
MISVFDLLTLSQIPGIGSNRLRMLISHFGNTDEVLTASIREIAIVEGFSRKLASTIVHFVRSQKHSEAKRYAERQLSKVNKVEGKVITFLDKQYPENLKKIYDSPPFLFVRGEFTDKDMYAIAIVGTRTPSDYGVRMTEKISQELAVLGITIVSGLARGIDTVAHHAAIKTDGRTLSVIGSGLDVIYPPENKNLFERIVGCGAVISEYEMGAKPDAVNFPRRNRIISGLSLGTVIIETDINGGAMITANTALDQNREVFALPGLVNSKRSRGCHLLIKEGRAKLIESIDDILEELSTKLKPLIKPKDHDEIKQLPSLTLFERSIYDVLTENPSHIDSIAEAAILTTSDVLVNLLSLEFKGLVKQLPGKMFVKN